MSVAFDSLALELVLAHGAVAFVVAGAAGQLGLLGARRLRGLEVPAARVRTLACTVSAAFVLAFGLGLLAYPHYRVAVRGLVLDRQSPWASNLFDVKENLAAFSLPLLGVVLALEHDQRAPRLSGFFCVALAASVAVIVGSGLVVTLVPGP